MKRLIAYLTKTLGAWRFKRGRTVRVMFSFSVLSIALLLGAAAITGADVSYIRLQSSATTVKNGDKFSIDIYANAAVPVNAVDVTLQFDRNKVQVDGVDRGQSVLTLWTEDPVIKDGKVILSGGTFRKGFIGEHKIATVRLIAKQTGQTDFSVTDVLLLAGDGTGAPVKTTNSTDSSVSLYVYDTTTDPAAIGPKVAVNVVTDIDGDGVVNLKDVSSFMGAWASNSYIYDFNGDGKMSFTDFSIILADSFKKK